MIRDRDDAVECGLEESPAPSDYTGPLISKPSVLVTSQLVTLAQQHALENLVCLDWMFSSLEKPSRWLKPNCEPDRNFRFSFWSQSVSLRCQLLVVLYSPKPALTLSRAAERTGYAPVSTAPHVRHAPQGWTDPAWSGSVPSREHMMTELWHTGSDYSHG